MPSNMELCKEELDRHNALTPSLNKHISDITNAIPFNISDHMKAVIAVTQITTFAAQFRRNLLLSEGTEVPINAISFIVSGSGQNKDSSVRAAAKCFDPGYELIRNHNHKLLVDAAIQAASEAGDEPADTQAIYSQYLQPEVDIETMPTTGPGLIDHINSVMNMPLGASLVSSSEFADELAYNPDMVENIKLLSETYDLGRKQSKHTKGAEFRSKSINGASTNALFIGSPTYLLYDEATKRKFEVAFMSKLARRSWFCYSPEKISDPTFETRAELKAYRKAIKDTAAQARAALSSYIVDVANFGIATAGNLISIDEAVEELFDDYLIYNEGVAESMPNSSSTSALIRRHLQWKALKLAGALAIMDKSNSVKLTHYIDAIRFCELLDGDMPHFESHLNKSDHERFSEYIRTQVDMEGHASISLHDLKKMGFVKSTSQSKLHELVQLSAGFDKSGIYNVSSDGGAIEYESIILTDTIGVSYKPIDCSALNACLASGDLEGAKSAKHNIGMTVAYGYEYETTTFDKLGELFQHDLAYSPFKFNHGVRGKDNIIGGTKYLVLDIDDSKLSASEASFMLSDINHYVALSSDPNNEFKFRVILELDTNIDLSPIAWKHFLSIVSEDLALKVDPVPQSQIFFSYAGRPVISNLEASPLVTRDYVMLARERESEKQTQQRQLTSAQSKALLADPETTFSFLYNAKNGEGSRNMIRAAYYAKDLGADVSYVKQLLLDVNELWDMEFGGMEQSRFEKIIEQIERLF